MLRNSFRWILFCSAASVLLQLSLVPKVGATAPVPDSQVMPDDLQLWLDGGPDGSRAMPRPLGPFNYLREFDQMVAFFAQWQVLDPESDDYGGMIEAESGDLGDVIQTDNTLEAIWCWSRYRELTGRDTYDANVAAAWEYCHDYPAWEEEGAPGDNYYRVHNSAWGLTAILQYEAATGDASYWRYADFCHAYIVNHPLNLSQGDVWQRRLNAFVKGWAAGNLYLYGESEGDQALMDAALIQGQDVLDWLNTSPPNYLGYEYWAMSSGTALWGVCNSVFRADPGAGQVWLAQNAQYLDLWQDWYDVPGYDWDSSWNIAFCNAHFAIWDVTGDQAYWDNGKVIADALLSLDTDDDGGITAESIDLDDEDMSWVTCYLVKMGVNRLLGVPPQHDVGVLRFVGLENGRHFDLGQSIPIQILASNFALNDEVDVTVFLSGGAGENSWSVDLPFASLDTLTHAEAWIPEEEGYYTLYAWTDLDGDEVPDNDQISIIIRVGDVTAVAGAEPAGTVLSGPNLNPFRRDVMFRVDLAEAAPLQLEIFDIRGRRVTTLTRGVSRAGNHALAWNGRDARGRDVPAGVYLYRLVAGFNSRQGKLLKVR